MQVKDRRIEVYMNASFVVAWNVGNEKSEEFIVDCHIAEFAPPLCKGYGIRPNIFLLSVASS
jgi:hypothetical protein